MVPELHVRSGTPPLSWETFTTSHPAGSIALDGYVTGAPHYTAVGPYQNFNHHEDVDRLATLSTAQQILRAARMGLDKAFASNGEFSPQVFVNDCDEDVCASWYLLKNIKMALNTNNPPLNRFVEVAGTLDATAGAYPYNKDMQLLGQLAWVFEPYSDFRSSGEMSLHDNAQYASIIQAVGRRIGQHLNGNGKTVALDMRYKNIGGGKDWSMIEAIGREGRVGALRDGIQAYVIAQAIGTDRWRYTIGRVSEYIPFDIPRLIDRLNEYEGAGNDPWGGASTIGGSPRVNGSKLSPAMVEAVIRQQLN